MRFYEGVLEDNQLQYSYTLILDPDESKLLQCSRDGSVTIARVFLGNGQMPLSSKTPNNFLMKYYRQISVS